MRKGIFTSGMCWCRHQESVTGTVENLVWQTIITQIKIKIMMATKMFEITSVLSIRLRSRGRMNVEVAQVRETSSLNMVDQRGGGDKKRGKGVVEAAA